MVKVIKRFKERHHNFKLYDVGDTYLDDDMHRVKYLASQGFLELESGSDTENEGEKKKRRKKDVANDDSNA